MTLWGGRFDGKLDPFAWQLNASLTFDQRLAVQDVRGSLAWARALEGAGVLSPVEREKICRGLETVLAEAQTGTLAFLPGDEDIHSAVERRLGELTGTLAGKLHTGRSRNDQVATDLRLWLLEHLPVLEREIAMLQAVLVGRAESGLDVLLPGYTHLQRAQPLLLGHWWLAHFWPLQRDRQRLGQLSHRTAILPLGSGALAGTTFPVDRHSLAEDLGFQAACPNSIDGVSDRDFVAEFLFAAGLLGIHLSRLAEAVILFSTAEFGFFELSDSYATGSSLMPQKKNPDVFELARGKAGSLTGLLAGLMATLKGLPSAYDKDLQEDKMPVFSAYDSLTALLPVMSGALASLTVHPNRMRASLDASMLATDLADYLVMRGVSFREAHHLTGRAVSAAAASGVSLDKLPLEAFQVLSPIFGPDLFDVFNPLSSTARRQAYGGTARSAVENQLVETRSALQHPLFSR